MLHVLNNIANKARKLSAKEIDIVADFYNELSVKSTTRGGRGTASRVAVDLEAELPSDSNYRLSNSNFKQYLDACFSTPNTEYRDQLAMGRQFFVTKGESVIERLNGLVSKRHICLRGSE